MVLRLTTLAVSSLALVTASQALAQSAETPIRAASSAETPFARFVPRPEARDGRIDYSAWTDAMTYLVLPMGRSLRQSPGTPDPGMGTRRVYGHSSRYRLEGNRVMFSFFNEDLKAMIADYRKELQDTAGKVDITSLHRNEQLAFWFNLHNVALMEQIAHAWPVRQPRSLEVDGVPLDQAKFITVDGVRLSLHDIRTKIVYPNWQDPRVIYGFWRGEIGGPSIPSEAYARVNIQRLLNRNAGEFVNSLRGVQKRGDRMQVSTFYDEARPFYFPDWVGDMRAHIAEYAEADVEEILAKTTTVEPAIEEPDIADLAGGAREPSYSLVESNGKAVSARIPQGMMRLLRERQIKFERAARKPRTGTVTFEPIDLPGQENNTEVE